MSHIIDKDVKRILGKYEYQDCVKPYYPDWCILTNGVLRAIEYENSSRGLLIHTVKYIRLGKLNPDIKYEVFLLRSLTHQTKHKQDYELSICIKDIQPNVTIDIINSEETAEFLLSVRDNKFV